MIAKLQHSTPDWAMGQVKGIIEAVNQRFLLKYKRAAKPGDIIWHCLSCPWKSTNTSDLSVMDYLANPNGGRILVPGTHPVVKIKILCPSCGEETINAAVNKDGQIISPPASTIINLP